MRSGASAVLVVALAACGGEGAGVQAPSEVIREVSTGLRQTYRVQMSVRASAEEPAAEDVALRKQIEDRIDAENIGRLVSSSGGAGRMEIIVEVDDTPTAISKMQNALRDLDVQRDVTFKVLPKEDSE